MEFVPDIELKTKIIWSEEGEDCTQTEYIADAEHDKAVISQLVSQYDKCEAQAGKLLKMQEELILLAETLRGRVPGAKIFLFQHPKKDVVFQFDLKCCGGINFNIHRNKIDEIE